MNNLLKIFLVVLSLCVISAFAQFSAKHGIMAISQDLSQYVGKQYVYTDVIKQFKQPYFPPFPYRDDRVRDGKYKASETAMDNYLKTLQSYFGKKFTVVRFERGEFNIPSPIMACENGDTLFFQGNVVDMQFVDAPYYDSQLANAGAKLKIIGNSTESTQNNAYSNVFLGCKNLKDGSYSHEMPLNTEWTIKSVSFDTTYVGDFTMFSDSENFRKYDRFKYTIQNKQYGTFECFPNNHLSDFEIKK